MAVAAFPEVEAWWESRTVGPHLDIVPSDLWRVANAMRQRVQASTSVPLMRGV
jgi:hypothetical protein